MNKLTERGYTVDQNKQKAVDFIGQLVGKIFEQLIRGDYDYEKDLARLEKYLGQARQLDAPLLEAQILNNIAILNNVSGRPDLCEEYLWQVYEIYEGLGETSKLCSTIGNLATVNSTRGDYEAALDLYDRGLKISDEISSHLISGKMDVLLVLQRFDEVVACFESIADRLDEMLEIDGRANYTRRMSSMYRALAEVCLQRQQFDDAAYYINQARSLAEGLNLTFGLAEIYFTCAHIALLQHRDQELANTYWQKAQDTFNGILSPSHVGRSYLEESRYLHQKGFREEARHFAHEAAAIFEQHNMQNDLLLAEELLN